LHFCSLGLFTLLAGLFLLSLAASIIEFLFEDVLALLALSLELKDSHLVVVVLLVVGTAVAKTARHIRLATVVVLAALVGHATDGAHTNVLIDEVFSSEVVKDLSIFDTFFIVTLLAALLNVVELLADNSLHGGKDLDEVLRLVLEDGVVSEKTELLVDALGPGADLIVDNVDALEFIGEARLVTLNLISLLAQEENF